MNSIVNNIVFPYPLSDNKAYAWQNNLKGLAWCKYWLSIAIGFVKVNNKLKKTLKNKICYYGPFKGEFGHFLVHTLPFLMYLHKNNVKIIYCGMELHKAFLVDEKGDSIVSKFHTLRDFFKEVPPNSNSTIPPADVQQQIKKFEQEALQSGLPFWNIGDDFYYWFIHRNWLTKKNTIINDLSKVYKTTKKNAVCIFPRNKGATLTHNNGELWDYAQLIELVKPYFDKIYVVGNPSQSAEVVASDKVEIRITTDNAKILEACSNSKLIITQHSGAVFLGEYTQSDVLIIYKGGNKIQDIGSLNNTLRFKNEFPNRSKLLFAFSDKEIVEKIKENNFKTN